MLYQVLARANAQAAWEPYQAMTRDPLHAMTLLQQASRMYPEVSIIQAGTARLLREQVLRLRAGEPSGQEVCPMPSLSGTPRLSVVGATIESQRWAIEQGPGGDHDVPYRFDSPVSEQTLRRWAQLMVAVQRQDKEAAEASDSAELAGLAECATDHAPLEVAPEAEPTTVRSERIG